MQISDSQSGPVLPTLAQAGAQSMTMASALVGCYEKFAGCVAIVDPDRARLTYDELGSYARRILCALRDLGLQAGSRVAILSPNRWEYMVMDHAILLGGFVRVPINYRLHREEVRVILEMSHAEVALVDTARVSEVQSIAPSLVIVEVGSTTPSQNLQFAALLEAKEGRPEPILAGDLAWAPFTSGSTGDPKAVLHSHSSILSSARNLLAEVPAAGTEDCLLHLTPLSHFSGYVALAYTLRGATHVMMDNVDPQRALAAIESHRVTVLPLVPTLVSALANATIDGTYDTTSLTAVIYGGAPMAPARVARALKAFGPVLYQSYGMTEMPWVSWLSARDHDRFLGNDQQVLSSAGRISPFVEMRIADVRGPVGGGMPFGEIQIRGDAGMVGYDGVGTSGLSGKSPDGWISTGDVGFVKDGYLYIADRLNDMIISGGFNIYPTEVESVISRLESVAHVAVFGLPDPHWGEIVTAVVVPSEGKVVSRVDVEHVCAEHIAKYKRPRRIEFLDEMPLTGTGKISRREAKRLFMDGSDEPAVPTRSDRSVG